MTQISCLLSFLHSSPQIFEKKGNCLQSSEAKSASQLLCIKYYKASQTWTKEFKLRTKIKDERIYNNQLGSVGTIKTFHLSLLTEIIPKFQFHFKRIISRHGKHLLFCDLAQWKLPFQHATVVYCHMFGKKSLQICHKSQAC